MSFWGLYDCFYRDMLWSDPICTQSVRNLNLNSPTPL